MVWGAKTGWDSWNRRHLAGRWIPVPCAKSEMACVQRRLSIEATISL
jgi:hypothetical protein